MTVIMKKLYKKSKKLKIKIFRKRYKGEERGFGII